MTAPAKRLIKSANPARGGAQSAPAESANTARVFFGALVRLGYDKQALLGAAGLDLTISEDPDALVPCQAIEAMFGYAMRTRPLKNLGMRLAAEVPIGAFPLLDYLIVTCDVVASGVKQLARYLRLGGAPYRLEVREEENPIQIMFEGNRDYFTFEFGICLTLLHLREETEQRLRGSYVSFVHRPEDAAEMERVLGCPVRGAAGCNSFALSREAWLLPMRRRDSVLRTMLEQQAGEIISRLPADDGVTQEIRQAILSGIAKGDTEMQSVARTLATSARSLQRRLAAAGTSYQKLLDSMRCEAARRYLKDHTLSVGEIAYLLGYSEPAAFHRAFKRWNGKTPQEFRHQGIAREESRGIRL